MGPNPETYHPQGILTQHRARRASWTAPEPPAGGAGAHPAAEGSSDGRKGSASPFPSPFPLPLRARASHVPSAAAHTTGRALEGQPGTRLHPLPAGLGREQAAAPRPARAAGREKGLWPDDDAAPPPAPQRAPAAFAATFSPPGARPWLAGLGRPRRCPPAGGGAGERRDRAGGEGAGTEPRPDRYLRPARTAPPWAARLSL